MRNFVCDVRLLQMLAFIQLIREGGGRKVSTTGYYFHILFTELFKKNTFCRHFSFKYSQGVCKKLLFLKSGAM